MLDQVRELYEDYLAEFQRLELERRAGAGMFGMTNGPRNYPCHERFHKQLERLLKDGLSPEEAGPLLEYIYFTPQAREDRQDAVYWMLTAVHGLTEPLIGLLSPDCAGRLLARYETAYPRRTWLPAQKRVVSALKQRAKA